MSQLIDEDGDSWNEELIRGIFDEEDVEGILQIPLRRSQNEDFHFWNPDSKRVFSMKNAYRMWAANLVEERIVASHVGYHKYRDLEKHASPMEEIMGLANFPKNKGVWVESL